jgi:hypothetical protein
MLVFLLYRYLTLVNPLSNLSYNKLTEFPATPLNVHTLRKLYA